MRTSLLRIAFLILGVTLVMVLAIIFPSNEPPKRIKTATEIYKEADYLVYMEVAFEHKTAKLPDGTQASGVLFRHRDRYCILTVGHIQPANSNWEIKEIRFRFKNQPGIYYAAVHALNEEKDFAVLEILPVGGKEFIFLGKFPTFGSSSSLEIGEPVYSLGSPLETEFTFGAGIVKNKTLDNWYWGSVIIHNADIAYGSSGGPLLNQYGEIVGINRGMHTQFTNFCSAGYIDDVMEWLKTEGGNK